jgi:hypothetical protein
LICQAQAALMALEDKPLEDVAAINGLIAKIHFDSKQSARITRAQASALAEKLDLMRLRLSMGSTLLEADIEHREAFLKNREARRTLSDNLP